MNPLAHDGKRYFAIAFPNVSDGYEIYQQPLFQGLYRPKGNLPHQTIRESRDTCYVFEGFMDYLSFLTLRQESCPNYPKLSGQDYIVLNSVSNVDKVLYPLGNYERIHCFFNSDQCGMEALRQIRKEYGRDRYIRDASQTYNRMPQRTERILTRNRLKKRASPIRQRGARTSHRKRKTAFGYSPL